MEKYTEVFYWGSDSCGQFGVGDRSIGKNYPNPKCCSFCIPIKKISCGDEHSGFIAANGYVYMMGSNKQGRLGISNPSLTYASRPLILETLADFQIIDLSCGSHFTSCLTTSGQVFTWGSNTHGSLGHNETEISWSPKKVLLNNSIISVSSGSRHMAVVSEDSQLIVWGAGEAGQLGLGSRSAQRFPVVTSLANVSEVSCGVSHTLVLLKNSEVLAAGGNSFGQLGVGTKEGCITFAKILGLSGKNVSKIAAGQHSAAITASGDLYVWGTGVFGEFLQPAKLNCSSKLVDLSVGVGFGIALDRNGTLWGWGSNSSGCLGTGDLDPKTQPYPIIDLQSKVVTQLSCGNGFVIALGKDLDVNKAQMSYSKSSDLTSVLEEMKKEINRLQKGTGGLEDLNNKLEQSKIKQNHIQSLLFEETKQKEHFEDIVKDLIREKESLKKEVGEVSKENLELKEFIEGLQSEVDRKTFEIEKMKNRLGEVESDHFLVSNEKGDYWKLNEQMEVMVERLREKDEEIRGLLEKLQDRDGEISEIKTSSDGIVNHNSVLSQEIKEIPVFLGKLQGLEKKLAEVSESLNEKITEKDLKDKENQKLHGKVHELNETIKALQSEVHNKDIEKVKISNISTDLQSEKEKNTDLTSQLQHLEEKLQTIEHSNFIKLENFSKEISLLNERLGNYSQEIEYYKEQNTEQEKLIKRLKNDLKISQENLELGKEKNKTLEQELLKLNSKNKEFINELTKQVASRAEAYKTLNSMSFNPKKTVKRVDLSEEEDLDLIYGKP